MVIIYIHLYEMIYCTVLLKRETADALPIANSLTLHHSSMSNKTVIICSYSN